MASVAKTSTAAGVARACDPAPRCRGWSLSSRLRAIYPVPSWRRTGLSVHNGVRVEPEDQSEMERLVRYTMRPASETQLSRSFPQLVESRPTESSFLLMTSFGHRDGTGR